MKRWTIALTALLLGACDSPVDEGQIRAEPLVMHDGAFTEVENQEPEEEAEIVPEAPEVPPAGDPGDGEDPEVVDAIDVQEMLRRAERTRRQRLARENAPSRERIWDLLHLPQEDAEATALLRICASEIEWANERDCLGIFQVAQSVRSRHCDNSRFGSSVRESKRISQCRMESDESLVVVGPTEVVEGAEETFLSAFRRLSDRAIGAVPPRTRRGRWISSVMLDCEEPEHWPESRPWEGRMRRRCEDAANLVRGLISGDRTRRLVNGAVPIAWGGRCEDHCTDPSDPETCRASGACDDRLACRRRLARIPNTGTGNAFWCRVGSRGCSTEIDPVCHQFGVR